MMRDHQWTHRPVGSPNVFRSGSCCGGSPGPDQAASTGGSSHCVPAPRRSTVGISIRSWPRHVSGCLLYRSVFPASRPRCSRTFRIFHASIGMTSIRTPISGATSSRAASISPRSSTPSRKARSFAVKSNRKANLSRQSATVSLIHASTSPLAARLSRGRQIASYRRNSR